MNFNFKDLYPNMGVAETSTEVIPSADDMEALNENAQESATASLRHARGKNILIAVGILLGLVIFLGGGD